MDGIGLDGLDGLDGSLGLVEYRAPYGANNKHCVLIPQGEKPKKEEGVITLREDEDYWLPAPVTHVQGGDQSVEERTLDRQLQSAGLHCLAPAEVDGDILELVHHCAALMSL